MVELWAVGGVGRWWMKYGNLARSYGGARDMVDSSLGEDGRVI